MVGILIYFFNPNSNRLTCIKLVCMEWLQTKIFRSTRHVERALIIIHNLYFLSNTLGEQIQGHPRPWGSQLGGEKLSSRHLITECPWIPEDGSSKFALFESSCITRLGTTWRYLVRETFL